MLYLTVFLAFLVNFTIAIPCQDKVSACRKASFTCWNPKVGYVVQQNCPATCRQPRCSSNNLIDHQSCHSWAKRNLCQGHLKAEMSVYCPNACNKQTKTTTTQKKTTRTPIIKTTTLRPIINSPKYPLWEHSLNQTADTCGSFYDFTCGQYQLENKPTPRESFSRLTDHMKLVRQRQEELIFDDSSTQSSAVKTMRQYRAKCMNTQEVERQRAGQLIADIKSMGDMPMLVGSKWQANKFDLTQLLLKINDKSTLQLLFEVGVTEQKKSSNLNTRSLLFAGGDLLIRQPEDYKDAQKRDKIKALRHFLVDLLQILAADTRSSQTYAQINTAVNEIVDFEGKIAEIYVDLQLSSAQHLEDALTQKRKFSDLKTLADTINWDLYFSKSSAFSDPRLQKHIASNPDIFILTEELVRKLNQLIKSTSPQILANYLITRMIVSRTAYLDSRFGDAARRFATQLDGGSGPMRREDECLDTILANFPLVVDHLYVKRWMSATTENAALKLWSHLKKGAETLIGQQQWLTPKSRASSLQKLKGMEPIMGALEEAKDLTKLNQIYGKIRFQSQDSYMKMAEKVKLEKGKMNFDGLFVNQNLNIDLEKEDRLRSGYIDAFVLKRKNKIFIPAAILHDPLFDPKLPASVNLGSFGFVVAQIMMLAFDHKGSHYNSQGQKQSIWDKKTRKGFKDARECLYDKYGSHADPLSGINVDAERTMRNNLADAAGIRIVIEAYKDLMSIDSNVSGYEIYNGQQSLFISYGVTFCFSRTKEFQTELLKSSPFAPDFFRVNIVLANYPEFQKVFNCKTGSRMIANPKCSAW